LAGTTEKGGGGTLGPIEKNKRLQKVKKKKINKKIFETFVMLRK